MNKHLKLEDILPYFSSDSECIQICFKGHGWETFDEFHGNSPSLEMLGRFLGDEYYISDIGCIAEDTIRIMLSRGIPLAEMCDG